MTSSTARSSRDASWTTKPDLDGIADAYAAMNERRAIKSLVRVGSV